MTSDRTVLRILLVVVAVVVLLPVLMMAFMMPMMGMWGWGMGEGASWTGAGGWMWLLMWIVPLVVVAGIGYLLYAVVRGTTSAASDRALEELRVAYARGDLTDEEFEQRRERLRREE